MQNEKNLYLYINDRRRHDIIRSLTRLKEKHPAMFTWMSPEEDIIAYFFNKIFAVGFPSTCYISNTSLSSDEDLQFITVRPKVSARLLDLLPHGRSIAIQGHVIVTSPEPYITVGRIVEIPDSNARTFEQEAYVRTQWYVQGMKRQNTVFTPEMIVSLPLISAKTAENLADWHEYLEWRQQIAENRMKGIRYIGTYIEERENGYAIGFQTAARSHADWEQFIRRYVRRLEMSVFPLRASQDEWDFSPVKTKELPRALRLGGFVDARLDGAGGDLRLGEEEDDFPDADWENAVVGTICFELDDDAQSDLMNATQDEMDALQADIGSRFPQHGFLVPSVAGEFSLINRQNRAIQTIQKESGEAPFLSSWLFDIEQANVPEERIEIEHFKRDDLNEEQREAVRQMVEAPDVYLLQGPPGTGKTTVIAEAIYQFARRGEKVLLSSQANLAVDNVFERLANTPEIRVIRLGKTDRISKEFSEDRVLRWFYHSVSSDVEANFLTPWEEEDRRLERGRQGLEEVAFMLADAQALQRRVKEMEQQIEQIRMQVIAEQKRIEDVRVQNDNIRVFHTYLDGYRKWLQEGEDREFMLPVPLVGKSRKQLCLPILSLRQHAVSVAPPMLVEWHEEQVAEQILAMRLLYRKWLRLQAFLPVMEKDAARLQQGRAGAVDLQTAIRIEQLKQQRQDMTKQLEEDEDNLSLLKQWRNLGKEIRELEEAQSFVFAAEYDEFLSGLLHGQPYISQLKQLVQEAKYEEASARIAFVCERVREVEREIQQAAGRLVQEAEQLRLTLQEQPINEQEIRKLTAELDRSTARFEQEQKSLADRRDAFRQRLLELHKWAALSKEVTSYQGIIEGVRKQLEQVEKQHAQNQPIREKWQPFLTEWTRRLRDEQSYRNDQEYYLNTYIEACNVVGVSCTENARVLEERNHTAFDVVIVDEVSKATPPELLIPMIRGRKTILVGDHRQLPPVFTEHEKQYQEMAEGQEDDEESLLTVDNFRRFERMVTASLFKEYFEAADPSIKSSLLTQYRMHPNIMYTVNHFYEYKLECGLAKPDQLRDHGLTIPSVEGVSFVTPNRHALWVDTSKDPTGRSYYEVQTGSSKVNHLECRLIMETLRKMDEAYAQAGLEGKKDVGVISFYGKQIGELRRLKKQMQFAHLDVDINTVDRFQGKEKSIILVSMVRHKRMAKHFKRPDAHVASFQRINVAFSRARELLVVFGARDMFHDWPVELPNMDSRGSQIREIYGTILDSLYQKGCFFESQHIISAKDYQREAAGGEKSSAGGATYGKDAVSLGN